MVTDVTQAVKDAKQSNVDFRMDKSSIVHVGLGKVQKNLLLPRLPKQLSIIFAMIHKISTSFPTNLILLLKNVGEFIRILFTGEYRRFCECPFACKTSWFEER